MSNLMSPVQHLERAKTFLALAAEHSGSPKEGQLLIAAVYAARAVYENLYTQAQSGQSKLSVDELISLFRSRVRRFKMIEYLRDHDFHRRPVVFADGVMSVHGPIRLQVTQAGSIARMSVSPDGKKAEHKFRNAAVKQDRPITVSGFAVSDPDSQEMLDIREALKEYLSDVEPLVSDNTES